MDIHIFAIGKQKFQELQNLETVYVKRISRFAGIEIVRNKETTPQKEEEWFLDKMSSPGMHIVLDEHGKGMTSHAFANMIQEANDHTRPVNFYIGGHSGISKNVAQRATHTVSLSKMTFTHLLVPTILLEQLYRAFSIISGHPYHRE